ncbi:MAG: winged helix-turn-helix domain-containing protein [Acidobacteria bacterium]|nr:winged helix-turn-helix domain-containing protein [Acidobacteriota bacterium]
MDRIGTRDIAAAIGLSPRATRMRLARLAARGLVRELGQGTARSPAAVRHGAMTRWVRRRDRPVPTDWRSYYPSKETAQ